MIRHYVQTGDIWESIGPIKVTYLILDVEQSGKIILHNLLKGETTYVYEGFFTDDTSFVWQKAG